MDFMTFLYMYTSLALDVDRDTGLRTTHKNPSPTVAEEERVQMLSSKWGAISINATVIDDSDEGECIMSGAEDCAQSISAANTQTVGMSIFLAKVTLMLAQSAKEPFDLLSETTRFIQSYDFSNAVYCLQRNIPNFHRDTNLQESLYWFIGWTCLTQSEQHAQKLTSLLLIPGNNGFNGSIGMTPPAASPKNQGNPLGNGPANVGHAETVGLSKYTEVLYKKSQEIGIVPKCNITVISNSPISQVKVRIRFGEVKKEAVARNQKIAKHLAAKKIYEDLGW